MEIHNLPISEITWIRSEKERKEVSSSFFLIPSERKFPYKNKDGSLNCNLVRAAISRAAQHDYSEVEKKARNLYERYCKKEQSDHLLNVVALSEVKEKGGFWHNVLPIKNFYHPIYEIVKITKDKIKKMAENFKRFVPNYRPTLYIGHKDDRRSYGEITELAVKDDGLWAFIKPDDEGQELIEKKKFKYLSAEFHEHYMDKDTGKDAGAVLTGIALTNEPAHPSMTPIKVFSESFSKEDSLMEANELKKMLDEANANKKELEEKFKELETEKKTLEEEKKNLAEKADKMQKELDEANKKIFSEKKENWKNDWLGKGVAPAFMYEVEKLVLSEEDFKKYEPILEKTKKIELNEQKGDNTAKSNDDEKKFDELSDEIAGTKEKE